MRTTTNHSDTAEKTHCSIQHFIAQPIELHQVRLHARNLGRVRLGRNTLSCLTKHVLTEIDIQNAIAERTERAGDSSGPASKVGERVRSDAFVRQVSPHELDIELQQRMVNEVAVVIIGDRSGMKIIPRSTADARRQLPRWSRSF